MDVQIDQMTEQRIQWFPGHMNKASKEIREAFPRVDVFIELLDGRIPFSSANPMLAQLRGDKPCLRVMTKTDQSDPALNGVWQEFYESGAGVRVLPADLRNRGGADRVPGLCRKLYVANGGAREKITAMMVGIPNVGKSTLINRLAGRAVAKTGNQPALTRQQQFIEIQPGFILLDTPGLMWPNVENRCAGYRLAVTGAIRDTAISHVEVALFALGYLRERYAPNLIERYGLASVEMPEQEILADVGRRRGCLVAGGKVDLDRAAKVVIADIRDGRLGRITWETPTMIEAEMIEVERQREEKARKKAERKARWKSSGD